MLSKTKYLFLNPMYSELMDRIKGKGGNVKTGFIRRKDKVLVDGVVHHHPAHAAHQPANPDVVDGERGVFVSGRGLPQSRHHSSFHGVVHQREESELLRVDALSIVQVKQARRFPRGIEVDGDGHVVGPRLLSGQPWQVGGEDCSTTDMEGDAICLH